MILSLSYILIWLECALSNSYLHFKHFVSPLLQFPGFYDPPIADTV